MLYNSSSFKHDPNAHRIYIPQQFKLEQIKSCLVIVNFEGDIVTSDAGLTLIAELDQKIEITSRREMHVLKITDN